MPLAFQTVRRPIAGHRWKRVSERPGRIIMAKTFLITTALVCCVIAGLALLGKTRHAPGLIANTSKQKLGLRVTGLGKVASIQLPRARDTKQTEYVFGNRLDVRNPVGKDMAGNGNGADKTNIATYSTAFDKDFFADLTGEGAFIEDVIFWVGESPSEYYTTRATSRTVNAKAFLSENVVGELEMGGRKWRQTTRLWRLADSGVNKITYGYSTVISETGTCLDLNISFTERIAPPSVGNVTKYVKFDPSPKAQDANAKMRERIMGIVRNAAQTFSIE